jgi:hypothetical protein
MKNDKNLTVNELYDLVGFYGTPIKVTSAYNGAVLCKKYDPKKHAEIGTRVLVIICGEIQCVNGMAGQHSHAQSIIVASVHGDVEYQKAHPKEGATK